MSGRGFDHDPRAGVLSRLLRVATMSACAAGLFAACTKKPSVSFELDVPTDVVNRATWFEVGAFPGTTCPPGAQLTGGIPPTGSVARLVFPRESKNPPGLGDLTRGSYAFAAVAKVDDCSVVAVGCSVVDVSDSRDIKIALRAVDNPTGACANGTVCQSAECVPSSDNSDPSVGAGCSLQLLGAGPLGDPLAGTGTLASGPAIAPTSKGFLVAYREFDSLAGVARLSFLPIDNGGGALPLHVETLPSRCSGSDESDAVGLAFAGDVGLAVAARAPCGGTAGFDFYAIDPLGNVTKSGQELSASLANAHLALSTAHAVAPLPGKSDPLVAFTKDGQAFVNQTSGPRFAGGAAIPFGGTPPHRDAWVATSDKLVALLAGGVGGVAPPAPILDGGLDGGGESGVREGGASDAGPPGSVLRLNLVAAGASLGSLDQPLEFAGTWGSMAAQGKRLIVASGSATGGKPVAFRAFDLGAPTSAREDGFNTAGLGQVIYADVAFHQDHLFFAVEQPGSISLVAYDRATTTPVFLREILLGSDPRVPSLMNLRDGRIAVAASDTRVAIVWIAGRSLTPNDSVGGYAVFACRTP